VHGTSAVIQLAAFQNFQKLEVSCVRANHKVTPCDFFIYPCASCPLRQEVLAVANFPGPGYYRVVFRFSLGGNGFTSIPYFFDVRRGNNDPQQVIAARWDFPLLETKIIEPSATAIVTGDRVFEVEITVRNRERITVDLHGREGVEMCKVKGKTNMGQMVKYVFVLEFRAAGLYTLKVHLDSELAVEQNYMFIEGRIEQDPERVAALQAEFEARIRDLDEPRLLADIPDSVRELVDSWF
jgi:hypothetical protein